MHGTSLGIRVGARRLADLLGEMDPDATYYRALADRIRMLISDGRLPIGTRLPSERELAATLDRSRSTVVAAYNVLREAGFVESRRGSGSVAALPATVAHPAPVDFAHAVPAPLPGLAEYLRRAAEDVEAALAAPGFDLYGDEVLRARIAESYARDGLPTTDGQVLVTVGGQHAIASVARALVRRGDRVVMDSPCYPHAYDAFLAAGARILTTPVTVDGWDADHLLATIERFRPTVAYLMPDFQNPTGASMAPDLRAAVVATAARAGTTLVVDETTAALDIDRGWTDGPFARRARAHGADVVTVGSLSKSVWGGLRLGWIRADAATVTRLTRLRAAYDLGTPRLEQLVARGLLPDLPRLLPLRSEQLRASRDHLVDALREELPDWQVPNPSGGLSLWVRFDRPVATSLAVLARVHGLVLSPGPRFAMDGSHERFLRLPYTEPREQQARGVEILRSAWSALGNAAGAYDRDLEPVV